MRVLAIQHDAADAPAAAGEIVSQLGHTLDVIRVERHPVFPDTVDTDLLMTFGGGISLAGDDLPSWVADEQRLIRRYIDAGRPVVGMCLGGQMIAAALGAQVKRNREVEVGWHPVTRIKNSFSASTDEMFPDQWTALHWHQDTFDIPTGAEHLFSSEACTNQAFVLEDRVFGFQFHLEANERTVRLFNQVSPLRRREGPFVQDSQRVLAGIDTYLPSQTAILDAVIRYLLTWSSRSS